MSNDGGVLYAAAALDDTVLLLDSLVMNRARIEDVDFPVGLALSPIGDRMYVTNYFSQSVSVIDPPPPAATHRAEPWWRGSRSRPARMASPCIPRVNGSMSPISTLVTWFPSSTAQRLRWSTGWPSATAWSAASR